MTDSTNAKIYCPKETIKEMLKIQSDVGHETLRRNLENVKKLLAEAIEAADLEASNMSIGEDSASVYIYARDNRGTIKDTVQIVFRNHRNFD